MYISYFGKKTNFEFFLDVAKYICNSHKPKIYFLFQINIQILCLFLNKIFYIESLIKDIFLF